MKHGRSATGAALPVVVWVVVLLSTLSLVAFTTSLLDQHLARNTLDHAGALAVAEAGVAEALVVIARRGTGSPPDSLAGTLAGDSFAVRWTPAVGGGARVLATGSRGRSVRQLEIWVSSDAGGGLRISAWQDVR